MPSHWFRRGTTIPGSPREPVPWGLCVDLGSLHDKCQGDLWKGPLWSEPEAGCGPVSPQRKGDGITHPVEDTHELSPAHTCAPELPFPGALLLRPKSTQGHAGTFLDLGDLVGPPGIDCLEGVYILYGDGGKGEKI